MHIVINLPDTNITENIIRAAKWEDGSLFDMALRGAMRDAIILPKGHGDLIDREDLLRLESKWYHLRNGDAACPKIDIEHAPIIIEADRSEEE